ncbi:Ig-like domain-containing protein [Paenibacillus ginsengihumi]|uniref:Ig-like domain-containing protein n=1 Tax=Paenibacillus ginsengihumi TaxID=431596 RepID=UPI0003675DA1|nr:Ig-like domain-containing protein [Paenibacillus ginsengihumi]
MSKANKWIALLLSPVLAATLLQPAAGSASADAAGRLPAFPGAEGGGMYTTGGRGGEVYEVTNLNDSGPGSLRDAVSQGNRTIVFRVSGNIDLKSKLIIRASNLTLAGQTAPGDGISINHYPVIVDADNIIIRYLRFRLGDIPPGEEDAMSIRKRKNIIIDHSSFSWAIDEVLSPYENENTTVQWSIIGEALHMSKHKKGRHGFGGLWGSGNSTYHHNLIIHNASRNARFKGTVKEDPTLDFRNNVIYNWNYQSAYGGDASELNMINNYFKYGPDTLLDKRARLHEQTGSRGSVYIAGNYVDGSPEVTANNMLGVVLDEGKQVRTEPVPAAPVTTHTAEEAYELVLQQAGAILPKRDSVDARLVSDVRNRTGRQINSQREVGGWPELKSLPAPHDSDHDGMPDEWELAHGLNPSDPSDRNGDFNGDGYTNLEKYLNSIVSNGTNNPTVRLTKPQLHQQFRNNSTVLIAADAHDSDGKIDRVEFYVNGEKIGEDRKAPYQFAWRRVADGTYYVMAKAIDNSGTSTDSAAVPIHVNTNTRTAPWKAVDVGKPGIPGHTSVTDGVYTLKGSGNWREHDSFHFAYRKLKGDGEIVARIDSITDVAPHNRAGLMIRESLAPGAREAMMALSVRGEAYVAVFYDRSETGAALSETPPIAGLHTPYWVKLVRTGNTITGYISQDGSNWTPVSSTELTGISEVYIGLAVEAAKENNLIENYNTSKFSNVSLTGSVK